MGAVKAWVYYFAALWIIGAAWLFTEPLFSVLFQISSNNQVDKDWLDLILKIRDSVAIIIIISLTIWAFLETTRREEDATVYYYGR